ncbi:MAG TPA: hypothetical protein VFS39_17665 [Nitrospira sp.]|nr:hypothetical protein [Nitrospira sp.]
MPEYHALVKDVRVVSVVLLAPLIACPLLGVWLSGASLFPYLEFPPRTLKLEHEPFSWPVFVALAVSILFTVGPLVLHVLRANASSRGAATNSSLVTRHALPGPERCCVSFPWWGWVGVAWTGLWWTIAWTRWSWAEPFQEHTFTPVWLGYIVVVNAVSFARVRRCMMLNRPRYFLSLFPLSGAFWWIFEYLNRFVQNWHYVGVADLSPVEYLIRATLPFSTVLPAVLGTAEALTTFPRLYTGLDRFGAIRFDGGKGAGWLGAGSSCFGLLGIGLWPDYLFPFLWIGPLSLIISLQRVRGEPTILSPLAEGDWRVLWVTALAALICGFWWELWNWKSLAHWEYTVPFVHRFRLFEMPLLGYAGYLPFGLECLAVADYVLNRKFSGGVAYYFR